MVFLPTFCIKLQPVEHTADKFGKMSLKCVCIGEVDSAILAATHGWDILNFKI